MKKPQFELKRIFEDGSNEKPQIYPIAKMPINMKTNRRGFVGTGLSFGAFFTFMKPRQISEVIQNINNQKQKILLAHSNSINEICFSPNGKILASGSSDAKIKLWDVETGQVVKTLDNSSGGRVFSVHFSPDGKKLVSGDFSNKTKLWDIETGQIIKTFENENTSLYSVRFSPNGKTLTSGSSNPVINLWEIETGKLIKSYEGEIISVYEVNFSPDGKILASTGIRKYKKIYKSSVEFHDTATGDLLGKFKSIAKNASSIAFGPEGSILALAYSDEKIIKLWDFSRRKQRGELKGLLNNASSLCFSPDGKFLASTGGDIDKNIKLWDIEDNKLVAELEGHTAAIFTLSFSPDSKLLASGSDDRTIKLWDMTNKKFLTNLYDPIENNDDAIQYTFEEPVSGRTITYTLPCGSPIPINATCLCNCVEGTYQRFRNRSSNPSTYPNTICTCDSVCTCVPVYNK